MPSPKLQIAGGRTLDFLERVESHGVRFSPLSVDTLQVNITKMCNQACRHCHVDASPKRTESMDRRGIDACLRILADHPQITQLDVTGGAPELHPHFFFFVREARKLGKSVIVRHNLTVTFDGNPQTGESLRHLPNFFAEEQVQIISSLPYYQEHFTDKQRGRGVFQKSINSLRLLNDCGYGREDALQLHLVCNPVGAYLPANQSELEAQYKKALGSDFGVVFNRLFTITNMPINRFRGELERLGQYNAYIKRRVDAFNPRAAENVMCRSLLSVGYDGTIYDCDFNQMLGLPVETGGPATVFDFDLEAFLRRRIVTDTHCFGCTAGAGSSCGGATA
jgi:radical SAM/Cys-rich protein